MAKTSVLERGKKRAELFAKYNDKRKKLKLVVYSVDASQDEKEKAQLQLQKLPRNSSRIRQRNRCRVCGRPRAYNRLTGLCRMHMRGAVMKGFIPGMHKDSW
ncbi:MAG TPA: 30S ribosomal protein S14 [Gammaproteobacteria bacterium]|nr:30S ribosomal protein S14 [Gammaproteobacteria bacterium]